TTSVPGTTATPTTATPTTAPPTTIGPTTPPTITSPPTGGEYVSVFLSVGAHLAPFARQIAAGDAPEVVALNALLAGPTVDEMAGTPEVFGVVWGAELLFISIDGNVATVDFSGEFNSPTGTSGELSRLSALTLTLTSLPDVEHVVLMIDGERIQFFGGHGWNITPSLTLGDFIGNRGAFGEVAILSPAWWMPVTSPVMVTGYAEGFAGEVTYGLYDNDGLELATGEAAVMPSAYDYGSYEIAIPFSVETAQLGAVMVWDGSEGPTAQANLVEHPIWLMP
ncbi:MAG: hypothetical protein HKN91_12295, partial [Acidimicrobiia bacterium]|nr:hypothetical protein [Acidimicrobiia bacterium]